MFDPRVAKPARSPARETAARRAVARVGPLHGGTAGLPLFLRRHAAAGPASGTATQTRRANPAGLVVGAANDPWEHEADRVADQVTGTSGPAPSAGPALPRAEPGGSPGPGVPEVVHEVLRQPGQELDPAVRGAMEPQFGRDLGDVRVHVGARAADSARAVAAEAYAVGRHVVFAENRYAPSTPAGARLLAHELAHTVQQGDAGSLAEGTLRRQPTSLAAYPETERRTIAQSTVPTPMIDAAFLQSMFGTAAQNGGVATTVAFGGTVVFDPAIPAALQRGLTSTGAYLANSTNALPLGSTATLVLDLTRFGGPNASFRFSHFTHAEGHAPAGPVLLVENVGPAPAAVASVPVPVGNFTVGGQTFTAGPGWTPPLFGALQAVLARLPPAVAAEAAGTTFSLRGQGTADEAGHYLADRDEIEMHGNAFPASATTFGGADAGMRAITHEVGHLLDLRRLERSWRTFNAGGQTPAGQKALLDARSLSGSRWQKPAGGGAFQQVDARTATAGQAFREAAGRDGVRPGRAGTDPLTQGPTSYANTDWQELFAESFSLYVNDPALFRLIRPNLHAYFAARFPP